MSESHFSPGVGDRRAGGPLGKKVYEGFESKKINPGWLEGSFYKLKSRGIYSSEDENGQS